MRFLLIHIDKVFWVLFVQVLVSCVNLAPKHERGELPVPSSVGEGQVDAAHLKLPKWQEFYLDQTLQKLIGLALEHNRDLKIASANVEQLQALYQLRRSEQIPNIRSSLNVTNNRGSSGQIDYRNRTYSGQLLQLTSFEIDFWSRKKNVRAISESNYHASLANRLTVSISIINGTAETYYLWLNAKKRLNLHEHTIKVYQQLLELVEKRQDAGFATASDVARIKADLATVEVTEAQIEKDMHVYRAALQLIVGTDHSIHQYLFNNEDETTNSFNLILTDTISSHVLLNRPDIIEAEHRLMASHADIGVARAAFFPKLSLSGNINTSSATWNDLFNPWNASYTLTLMNSIFGQGRKANLRFAKAKQAEFLARYEKVIQTAFSEVYTQMKLCDTYKKELEAQSVRVAAQKNHLAFIEARYDAEISSYTEILVALEDLVEAEHAQLISERNQLLAKIQLYKALGGGISAYDEI